MHEILSLISGLLSSFAIAFVKTYLSNIYGPNACTKPSGPDFLAPQLIDCSWKVKTTKVPPKLWDPEQLIRFHIQFFYSEQAELRGSVSGTGLAAALVSCGLQHHTPDCGKFRWALQSPCSLFVNGNTAMLFEVWLLSWNGILFSGSEMYMAFGVKAGKVG